MVRYRSDKDRVLLSSVVNDGNGCWDWVKYKSIDGYGMLNRSGTDVS